jgi:hypothetical protein
MKGGTPSKAPRKYPSKNMPIFPPASTTLWKPWSFIHINTTLSIDLQNLKKLASPIETHTQAAQIPPSQFGWFWILLFSSPAGFSQFLTLFCRYRRILTIFSPSLTIFSLLGLYGPVWENSMGGKSLPRKKSLPSSLSEQEISLWSPLQWILSIECVCRWKVKDIYEAASGHHRS